MCSGELYGHESTLHVRKLRPSVWDTWGPDHIRGHVEGRTTDPATHQHSDDKVLRRRKTDGLGATKSGELEDVAGIHSSDSDDDEYSESADQVAETSNASLMRVFAMIFALEWVWTCSHRDNMADTSLLVRFATISLFAMPS